MSSGLPSKADVARCSRHVSKVPERDIVHAATRALRFGGSRGGQRQAKKGRLAPRATQSLRSTLTLQYVGIHKSVGRRARLHARSRAASQNVLQGCQRASCSAGSAIDHAQADEALEPSRSPCEAGPGQKDRYQRRRVRLQGDAQGTFADVRCRDRGHSCSNSKWRLMACLGLKFLVFMGLGF
jgi:hypothetical protein